MAMPIRRERPASPRPSRTSSASECRDGRPRSKFWSSTTSRRPRPKTDSAGGLFTRFFRLEGDRSIRLEFSVVTEIDRVPAAIARSADATQRLGMNGKQELALPDQHVIVIHCGLHRIERKTRRYVPRLHLDSQHTESFLI